MRRIGLVLLLTFLSFSCGPSYPKERVADALEKLCRDEYKISVKAQLAQTTLGVFVEIPGFIEELMKQAAGAQNDLPPPIVLEGQYAESEKEFRFQYLSRGSFTRAEKEKEEPKPRKEKRSQPLKTLDHISTALQRVCLSTNAKIEFYTMIIRDPGPANLDVIFSGHLDDLKQAQYYVISRGEFNRRNKVILRHQPEAVARQTVAGFLQDLTRRPLPQLLTRYVSSSGELSAMLPKILDLAVHLQGEHQKLIREDWPVRQISKEELVVYVSLEPLERPGAILFKVQLKEGQGGLIDIQRTETNLLPNEYYELGDPARWKESFYLEPIQLPQFISEQIAKRVLGEFKPLDEEEPAKKSAKKAPPAKPVTKEEMIDTLMATSAYIMKSYTFKDFKNITLTDAVNGTHWMVPAKELPLYLRRKHPQPKPIP